MLALRQARETNKFLEKYILSKWFSIRSRKAVRRRRERRRRRKSGRGGDGGADSWPRRPRTSLTTRT